MHKLNHSMLYQKKYSILLSLTLILVSILIIKASFFSSTSQVEEANFKANTEIKQQAITRETATKRIPASKTVQQEAKPTKSRITPKRIVPTKRINFKTGEVTKPQDEEQNEIDPRDDYLEEDIPQLKTKIIDKNQKSPVKPTAKTDAPYSDDGYYEEEDGYDEYAPEEEKENFEEFGPESEEGLFEAEETY